MALQTATNPETGERVALVDSQWVPITQTATNPETGDRVGLINGQWLPLPISAGIGKPTQAQELPQEEPKPAVQEEQSIFREIADVPLKLAGGVTTGVRLIADALGADNAISQNLRGVEDWIGALYSAQSKQDSQEIARIMKEAENEGVADQVVAGLKAFSVAPIDMVVNALGTSAPAIVAGLVSAPAMLGVGAVMGAGTAKSAIYDATKEILKEKTQMSPQQIEAAAVKAQEYGGENLDQILLSSGIGAFASRTGAEASIVKQITKSIEERAAIKKVQSEAAEAAAKKVAERGAIRQGALTAGKEFATESVQGGQEQFAANLAQQRQGFDTPLMQGVAGQATLEGVAGAGLGAISGARESMVEQRAQQAKPPSGEPDTDFQFTSEEGDVPSTQRGFTAEDADLLLPSSTQAGAATVEGVTRPEVTEETITPETVAQKYLDDIASGAVKPSWSKLKKLASDLGIEVETGEGSSQRAQEAIAARLKGQQDVTGTIDQTAGEGAGVAGEPGAAGAEGLGATVDGGVDTTGADTADVTGGEGTQPPAVELEDVPDFTDQTTAAPAVAEPTAENRTKARIAADEAQNEFEVLNEQVNELENEIAGLRLKDGKLPAPNSPARKKYDELTQQLETLRSQSDAAEARANRLFDDYKALSDENKLSARKEESTSALTFPQRRKIDNPVVKAALAKTPYERKEGVSVQNIPPDAEQKYNAAREELLPGIRDYNEKRKPLIKAVEEVEEKLKRLKKNNASEEEIGAAEDALNDAEFDLQEYGPEVTEPGEWYKLDSWEKEVLFDSIKSSSISGPDEADILDYRDGVAAISEVNTLLGEEKVTADAGERRIMLEYDRNRNAAKNRIKNQIEETTNKAFDFSLPRWSDLSDKAKDLFRNAVQIVNPNTNKLEPTLTLEQQDAGYEAVVAQLLAEENSRGALSPEIIKQREEQLNKFRAQREKDLAELKKVQEDYERRNKGAKAAGATTLPNNVIEQLQRGNLNAALDLLLARLNNKQNKSIAEKLQIQVLTQLRKLNLKTKVTVAGDMLPDGDLARYYTDDDHIIFSPSANSFTAHTLAHEVTHAATVTVLYRYLNKQYNMITAQQRAAAAQIEKLFRATKPFLGDEFANAYENPYEFVAYAMTNKGFANALKNLGVKNLYPGVSPEEGIELATVGKEVTVEEAGRQVNRTLGGPEIINRLKNIASILPAARNAWSVFKQSVAEILGIPPGRMSSVNYLMEMHAAFEDILAAPTEPIYLTGKSTLAAKGAKPKPKKVKEGETPKEKGLLEDDERYTVRDKISPSRLRQLIRRLTTREGWQDNIRDFQDKTYFTRVWQNTRAKADQITYDPSGAFTNIADQQDGAMADARNFVTYYVQEPVDALRKLVANYAEKYNRNIDKQVLPMIAKLAEMFHEPERRTVYFIMRVPLSTESTGPKGLTHNGKPISAADRRVQLVGDPAIGREGLIHRVDLKKEERLAIRKELEFLADNYADANGYGMAASSDMPPAEKAKLLDKNNSAYNAVGISLDTVKDRREEFNQLSEEERKDIEAIFDQIRKVAEVQKTLDKIGKYWSRPVDNLVGIYNYEYYMPFQGFNESAADRQLDPESLAAVESQEIPMPGTGRSETTTRSKNPLLALLANTYRAAGRAGRRNYTQSIKNAIEQGLIPEGKIVAEFTFAQRESDPKLIQQFKGAKGKSIFHYDSDGTLYIMQIRGNDRLLNSMRPELAQPNWLLDMANDITGFFGAMHTRYNYNFAPLNFVRDTLTNSWNIGASGDLGPAEAAKYLSYISKTVTKNGLGKAWTVARLHESGKPEDVAKLRAMMAKDPFVKDMLELIKYSGKTTYLEGFSLKSNLDKLSKGIGKSKIADKVEGFTQFVDSWNYMFEFTSRAAAYRLRRESMYKRFIKEGMKPAQAYVSAAKEAAIWTKNLANFEKVGTYGRGMGAAFMFFRPAVTGAVRAVEAVMPAFQFSEKTLVDMLPEDIRNNPTAKEKYLANFRKDRKNARIMVSALMGMGYTAYMMAALMSPDDDWGRNNVKNDNMQQWTRYWRIHLPDGGIVQIPWGFGLGAFAAIGAQIASMAHGNEPIADGINNIVFSIMTDAFFPLPISRMSAIDEPVSWVVDTFTPTALRPFVEYTMNKDGLGRTINSTSQRRMGDAYTGGDKINEMYKDAAQLFYRSTDGAIDMSPNSVYFFANSYADGVGKIAESLYSFGLLGAGQKEFKAKTDVPFIGSFIGAETNVDSREYGEMEKKIKNIDKRLNTLKTDEPESYARFLSNNPTYPMIVDIYKAGQGNLNRVRAQMNKIRANRYLYPKDRDQILEELQFRQNIIKYKMNLHFKELGLEP